jgi:hypothetical protein
MKTKPTLLFTFSLFFSLSLFSQVSNESVVVSVGGGTSSAGIYENFAVVGEPFVASPVAGATTSTNVGFIYRTADIQATVVNLTLFLEGLYGGAGFMNKAQGAAGNQYGGAIADKITFELHNAMNYAITAYSNANVDLNTNGSASLSVPSNISGSYYITVKHRNSLQTVSASPVSVSGSPISYNFSSAQSQAFGNRLKLLGEGVYGLYAGDVDANGQVNLSDINTISAAATTFGTGYIATDVNGDGVIDALDLILADNNAALGVSSSTP